MLCSFCDGVSISSLWELVEDEFCPDCFPQKAFYQHHASIEDLIESANSGCELCQLIVTCSKLTPCSFGDPVLSVFDYCQEGEMRSTDVKICLNTSHLFCTKEPQHLQMLDLLYVQFGPQAPKAKDREYDDEDCLEPMPISITIPRKKPVKVEAYDIQIGRFEIDPDLMSEANFDIARSWLVTCFESHECCPNRGLVGLPTRLVDVGTGLDCGEVHLIQTSPGEKAEYAALSHCWGGPVEPTLTRENLPAFLDNISLADLPKNFRDAVFITRKLGLRYIWIDSLCIIQDSPEDWGVEAGKMTELYLNATVTISASASEGSTVGIFTNTPSFDSGSTDGLETSISEAAESFDLRVFPKSSDDSSTVRIGPHFRALFPYGSTAEIDQMKIRCARFKRNMSPDVVENMCRLELDGALSRRAWGLQEKVLSSRRLIYGRKQIYWKCVNGCQCADGVPEGVLTGETPYTTLSRYLHDREFALETPLTRPDHTAIFDEYYAMVEEYSRRKLTYGSDKLPAFSGVARKLNPLFGGVYLAGIWSTDLLVGLSWYSSDGDWPNIPGPYRAPSWSWASTDRGVYFNRDPDSDKHFHLCRCPESSPLELLGHQLQHREQSNPYGQLDGGSLVLRGLAHKLFRTRLDRWAHPLEDRGITGRPDWDEATIPCKMELQISKVDGREVLVSLLQEDAGWGTMPAQPEQECTLLLLYTETLHVCTTVPTRDPSETNSPSSATHRLESGAILLEDSVSTKASGDGIHYDLSDGTTTWFGQDSRSTSASRRSDESASSHNEASWSGDEGALAEYAAENHQSETKREESEGEEEEGVGPVVEKKADHATEDDGDEEVCQCVCLVLRPSAGDGLGTYTRLGLVRISLPSLEYLQNWVVEEFTVV